MGQEEFAKYLKERYQDQINWYERKATENQRTYRALQWLVIVLAALTPVLIELDMPGGFAHVPTLTSAVVAILTAGLKTFQYQESWLNYRATCETLRKEQHYYEAGVEGYSDVLDEATTRSLFVQRVESLIARENTLWLSAQRRDKPGQGRQENVAG